MSEQPKNYITPVGFQKLKDEYSDLLNKQRPKIVETVAWAASNGDRSENADYHYGKKRLREIDGRLRYLMGRMENAEVVDPKLAINRDKVLFGATVTILNFDEEEVTYQIVGEDEFDIKASKISWKSPLARALLGKKLEDEVIVKKPMGEEIVTVVKIQFI